MNEQMPQPESVDPPTIPQPELFDTSRMTVGPENVPFTDALGEGLSRQYNRQCTVDPMIVQFPAERGPIDGLTPTTDAVHDLMTGILTNDGAADRYAVSRQLLGGSAENTTPGLAIIGFDGATPEDVATVSGQIRAGTNKTLAALGSPLRLPL